MQSIQTKEQIIKNHPTMKQVLAESFGGVMYNVANQGKYDTIDLMEQWNRLTASEKESMNGIINGAINFLNEKY